VRDIRHPSHSAWAGLAEDKTVFHPSEVDKLVKISGWAASHLLLETVHVVKSIAQSEIACANGVAVVEQKSYDWSNIDQEPFGMRTSLKLALLDTKIIDLLGCSKHRCPVGSLVKFSLNKREGSLA
jgi:hypothetical protein